MAGIRMRLVGDNVAMGHPRGGLSFFYEQIRDELSGGDLRFGNLEWPISTDDSYDPRKYGRPLGRMQPADADALVQAGFEVVSTANNHMLDYGQDAMLETLGHLDKRGIRHAGSGRTAAAAHEPALLEKNGVRVAVLAYTAVFLLPSHPLGPQDDEPQMATLRVATRYEIPHKLFDQPGTPPVITTTPDPDDVARLKADIAKARKMADAVIVSWHWGVSGGYRKRVPYQQEIGRLCVDAGASVVIGHHPHALQGVERYKDGVICYSLGNFVFWRFADPTANHDPYTVIVNADLDKTGVRAVSFTPVIFNENWQPAPAKSDAEVASVLEGLRRDSRELGTRLEARDGRIEIV